VQHEDFSRRPPEFNQDIGQPFPLPMTALVTDTASTQDQAHLGAVAEGVGGGVAFPAHAQRTNTAFFAPNRTGDNGWSVPGLQVVDELGRTKAFVHIPAVPA